MTKLFFKSIFCSLLLMVFFTSCQEDDFASDSIISNYEDDLVSNANIRGGGFGCFELVFPITIELSDGSQVSVADIDELKAEARADIETNGREAGKPDLIFPVDLIIDGETQTISDEESFEEIISDCKGSFGGKMGFRGKGGKGKFGKGSKCFSIAYPVTFVFSDGSTITVESREDKRTAFQEYKEANPDAMERPTVQFPITVTLDDETTQSIASEEELQALAESCRDDEDDEDDN